MNVKMLTGNSRVFTECYAEIHTNGSVIKGQGCVIYGNSNTIQGSGCTVWGNGNKLIGNSSLAIGNSNKLHGLNSSAVGNNNRIFKRVTDVSLLPPLTDKRLRGNGNDFNQPGVEIIGNGNNISGEGCTIYGNSNTVTGNRCTVYGDGNIISGDECYAEGNSNRLTGFGSSANGNDNRVRGAEGHERRSTGVRQSLDEFLDQPFYFPSHFQQQWQQWQRQQEANSSPRQQASEKPKLPDAIENEEAAVEGEPECKVCMERSIKTRLKPCEHVILCVSCALDIGLTKCPVCKTTIRRIKRVYF